MGSRICEFCGYDCDFDEVVKCIEDNFKEKACLVGATLKYAEYGGGGYEGWALVIFERDGKLYEVNGSHCSCMGLESQWEPEETSWRALAMRVPNELSEFAQDLLTRLCERELREG